jgi:hypothetical protein
LPRDKIMTGLKVSVSRYGLHEAVYVSRNLFPTDGVN